MECDVLIVERGGGIEVTPDDSGGSLNILEQCLARNGRTTVHEIRPVFPFGNVDNHCVLDVFMFFAPSWRSSWGYWGCIEKEVSEARKASLGMSLGAREKSSKIRTQEYCLILADERSHAAGKLNMSAIVQRTERGVM